MKLTSAEWGAPRARITRKDLVLCGVVLVALLIVGLWSKSLALRPGEIVTVRAGRKGTPYWPDCSPVRDHFGPAIDGISDELPVGTRVQVVSPGGQTTQVRVFAGEAIEDRSGNTYFGGRVCWVATEALTK
jgi:hypothetical protein